MSENWTPGPYKAHLVESDSGLDDRWEIHWSEDGECVAEIVHSEPEAYLLAASPEMYDALRDAAESLRFAADELKAQASIPDADERDIRKTREKVFKALARARGETP